MLIKLMKLTLEDKVVEVGTGKVFVVLGTPVNCKLYSTNQEVYIVADRAGNTLVLTKDDLIKKKFIKKIN